jgi:hypothetical protein
MKFQAISRISHRQIGGMTRWGSQVRALYRPFPQIISVFDFVLLIAFINPAFLVVSLWPAVRAQL